MSFILMARAIATDIQDPLAKWLLVVLADHANEETHKCFPSLDRLAIRTQMNRVTVTRKLNYLQEHGFVLRDRGNSKRSTIYTIYPDELPVVAECNKVVADSNPNLSIKPINKIEDYVPSAELIESLNKKGELDHDHEANQFRDFHVAKGTTFKDINRAYRYWCNNRIKWNAERQGSSKTARGWSAHSGRRKSSIFGGIYNSIQSERK